MMKMHYSNQTGDTLVEVLIALVILSVVLVGGARVSNASLLGVRQSQEHTEALKLAESQLEAVEAAASNSDQTAFNNMINQTNYFCVFSGAPIIATTPTPVPMTNVLPKAPNSYIGSCKQNSGITYEEAISTVNCSVFGYYIFTINVTWPSLQGSDYNQVTLHYKVD
jgi:Tfp pilus assembly protein PilX